MDPRCQRARRQKGELEADCGQGDQSGDVTSATPTLREAATYVHLTASNIRIDDLPSEGNHDDIPRAELPADSFSTHLFKLISLPFSFLVNSSNDCSGRLSEAFNSQ